MKTIVPIAASLSISLSFALSVASFAHAPPEGTQPADGAELDAVPDMLHVSFAAPARVVKVTMRHAGEDGESEMQLEPPSKEFSEQLHLTPEFPGPGAYKVAWRALGEDGHVMQGTFAFTVR